MKQTLITYKTWRQTHNPWSKLINPNTNLYTKWFTGNLTSDNEELVNELHYLIDEYFNPRIIGVTNPERFLTLMQTKLLNIEPNFFNSFYLDNNYPQLVDMLKNINMLSKTDTTTNMSGTNNGTNTNKTTNNLTETDEGSETSNGTDTNSPTKITREWDNTLDNNQEPYVVSNETLQINNLKTNDTIGEQKSNSTTDTNGTNSSESTNQQTITNNGSDTNSGTDTNKNRSIVSNTPQSNIGVGVAGIDANVDWNYASGLQDNKETITHGLKIDRVNTQTDNGTNNISNTSESSTTTDSTINEHTNETTNTGTVETNTAQNTSAIISKETISGSETEDSIQTTKTVELTKTNSNTKKNTGSIDVNGEHDSSYNQDATYNKENDNSGRTDNLAKIWMEWRNLLHKTLSSYMYLFNELDDLFFSIWDIDECEYNII